MERFTTLALWFLLLLFQGQGRLSAAKQGPSVLEFTEALEQRWCIYTCSICVSVCLCVGGMKGQGYQSKEHGPSKGAAYIDMCLIPGNSFFMFFKKFVLQKKEFDVDTLSKSELRMLLSVMEGELEARDLVIEALRVRAFRGWGPLLCRFFFQRGQWWSFFSLSFPLCTFKMFHHVKMCPLPRTSTCNHYKPKYRLYGKLEN